VFKNPFCTRNNNFIALASHAALAAPAARKALARQIRPSSETERQRDREKERGAEREGGREKEKVLNFSNQSFSPRRRPKPPRGEPEKKHRRARHKTGQDKAQRMTCSLRKNSRGDTKVSKRSRARVRSPFARLVLEQSISIDVISRGVSPKVSALAGLADSKTRV